VFYAGGGGVAAGGVDGAGIVVGGDDGGRIGRTGLFFGGDAEGFPGVGVVEEGVDEGVVGAEEAGGAAAGDEGGFDGEGAGAAHGVYEGLGAVVAGGEEDGGGEGFLHGGRVRHATVAAVGEALAAGVEVEPGAVFFPEEVDDDFGAVGAAVGTGSSAFLDAIDDGVFYDEVGVHGVVDGGVIDIGIDGEGGVVGDEFFPGEGMGVGVEGFGGGAAEAFEQPEDEEGGAEVEIEGHAIGEGGADADADMVFLLDVVAEIGYFIAQPGGDVGGGGEAGEAFFCGVDEGHGKASRHRGIKGSSEERFCLV